MHHLEQDAGIILRQNDGSEGRKEAVVDAPWYPADVRDGAMAGLADLFTSTKDNYLFPSTRYATGHDMSFLLRPG